MFSLEWDRYENTSSRNAFYWGAVVHNHINGKALFIKVWGKLGAKGQARIEQHARYTSAHNDLMELKGDRQKNGYRFIEKREKDGSFDDLLRTNREIMEKLLLNHRNFLDVEGTKSVVIEPLPPAPPTEEELAAEAKIVVRPEEYGTW